MINLQKYFIFHCTGTKADQVITGADIKRWHCSPVSKGGRGWAQVGYSDLIRLDGYIENLVPNNWDDKVDPWEITNGVAGINSVSRHIVYVGGLSNKGKPLNTLNKKQEESLIAFTRSIIAANRYIQVGGHNQWANKACPSFWTPKLLGLHEIPKDNIYLKDPFGYGKIYAR